MKRTFITIILALATPAICLGSTGVPLNLELSKLEKDAWDAYVLVLEHQWNNEAATTGALDMSTIPLDVEVTGSSLWKIPGGLPTQARNPPQDMVSMVSFVWAQMFGGVDVVAEVREFASKIRHKREYRKPGRTREKDPHGHWRFVVSCRVDELTEIAASFKNHGLLFNDGGLVLEISALDPLSEELGLKMAYGGGKLDIRADRMTLTETAEAKLVVKF